MRVALKLLAVMVSLVLMVLAVEAILRSRDDAALYEQDLRRDQRILGRALREAGELTWREQGLDAAQRIVAAAAAGEREVAVRVLREDEVGEQLDGLLAVPDVRAESDRDLFQFSEADALVTVVPLTGPRTPTTLTGPNGPSEARVALELSTPLTSKRAHLAKGMRRFASVAAMLVLATSLLGVAAGGWIVGRPIELLVRQTRSLAAGRFGHSRLAARDEIGQLGRALDQTSDRLSEARAQLEHETRERLEAMDKLRQADRLATVGTLAAGVAHELGTPLHVITGRAQRITRASDPSKAALEAEIIVEQCAVVQEIVRGLLDFARTPARERSELDLATIVARTVAMVEPLLRQSKATVALAPASASPRPGVLGNSSQLKQVFTNLLVNAAQAMPEGGEIRVAIEHRASAPLPDETPLPHRASEASHYALVRIRDQGTGMNRETLEHIYEPFFTTKQPGEGTGLGLSIAYGIVRDHGGWVDVASEPGRGTEFRVWLPEVHS